MTTGTSSTNGNIGMKLEVIKLKDENVYLCEKSPWGTPIECAGLPVNCPFTFAEPSDVVTVHRNPAPLLHWEDVNGDTLSSSEYAATCTLLYKCDDDGDWANIDDEYVYKKFKERWKAVYGEPSITREPVEIVVTEVRTNSGHPEIKSLWNASTVLRERCLYSVNTDSFLVSYLNKQCAIRGLRLDVPTHSGIRFAKIEGKYPFPDNSDHKGRIFIGTLKQCEEHLSKLEELVNAAVTVAFAAKTNTTLMNAGQVAESLRAVHSQLYSITATKASTSALNVVRDQVSTLIKNIVNNLNGNTNETP